MSSDDKNLKALVPAELKPLEKKKQRMTLDLRKSLIQKKLNPIALLHDLYPILEPKERLDAIKTLLNLVYKNDTKPKRSSKLVNNIQVNTAPSSRKPSNEKAITPSKLLEMLEAADDEEDESEEPTT